MYMMQIHWIHVWNFQTIKKVLLKSLPFFYSIKVHMVRISIHLFQFTVPMVQSPIFREHE